MNQTGATLSETYLSGIQVILLNLLLERKLPPVPPR